MGTIVCSLYNHVQTVMQKDSSWSAAPKSKSFGTGSWYLEPRLSFPRLLLLLLLLLECYHGQATILAVDSTPHRSAVIGNMTS